MKLYISDPFLKDSLLKRAWSGILILKFHVFPSLANTGRFGGGAAQEVTKEEGICHVLPAVHMTSNQPNLTTTPPAGCSPEIRGSDRKRHIRFHTEREGLTARFKQRIARIKHATFRSKLAPINSLIQTWFIAVLLLESKPSLGRIFEKVMRRSHGTRDLIHFKHP